MKKYFIIGLAAFILETASTMYIATVAERSMSMIFWASMGPFLGLPFVGYMVESKTWTERIKMAIASAIGYALGATVVYLLNLK
jgi:fucose permease